MSFITPSNLDRCAVHPLIVAAGSGSRFGGIIAKQYTKIADKTILEHSIARLSQSKYINRVTVVIAPNDNQINKLSFPIPVCLTTGGSERWQSVQAGVDTIIATGANEDDLVLIHDAARPCINYSDVDTVIEVAQQEPFGAILGVPITDTIKRVEPIQNNASSKQKATCSTILNTIDREDLWHAQTPQVFRLGILEKVLKYVSEHKLAITDEASAFEALNYPIKIVLGDKLNLKLTYAEDLVLLNFILQSSI